MKLLWISLVLSLCLLVKWTESGDVNSLDSDKESLVQVNQGTIQGKLMKAINGRNFHAFLGIPFGNASERFQEAKPAGQWTGVLNATQDAPSCLQYDSFFAKKVFGVEDCLTLNVYTPKLPENKTSEPLPVLLFIYGGGFIMGSADSKFYGPYRFMNNDVVLVTIQYRVGPFGFLSTHDEASQGNYGLLDQVLGLKWAKENIENFGGDPNKITIFGESAGGGSVIFHVLSPLSKGLFNNAIAQSGSALCPWAIQEKPLETASRIAIGVDCPTNDTKALVECLRKADAKDILTAANATGMYSDLRMATVPVIENKDGGKFLTESPWKLFKEGRFNKVPLIIGVTEHEGAFFAAFDGGRFTSELESPEKEFREKSLPHFIDFFTENKNDSKFQKEIEDLYFQGLNFTSRRDDKTRFVDFVSDSWFKGCVGSTAKFIARQDVPVYAYVFDYAVDLHSFSNITGKPDVDHGQDLLYQFVMDIPPFNETDTYTDEENEFSSNFINLWTNFANTSEPTSSADEYRWTKTPDDEIDYLRINTSPKMETGFLKDKLAFWEKVYDDDQ